MTAFRITYATMSADDDELQAADTTASPEVRNELGAVRRGGRDRMSQSSRS